MGIYSQMSEAANLEAEKAWVTGTGSPSALYPGKMLASESGKSIIDYTTSKKDAFAPTLTASTRGSAARAPVAAAAAAAAAAVAAAAAARSSKRAG